MDFIKDVFKIAIGVAIAYLVIAGLIVITFGGLA